MPTNHHPQGEFLNSNAQDFQKQFETALELFNDSSDIVQAGRNTLKKITLEGVDCVMKAFRVPSSPQNYSYGLVAKSKAKKSYDNGKKLIDLGFSTPAPVAYAEIKSGGKLKQSYYICEFAENTKTLHQLIEDGISDELIQQFATFCFNLHDQGILHRDFNPKNILVAENQGTFDFSLVDINRITWSSKLSLAKSMESLSRLPNTGSLRKLLLETYAKKAGEDLTKCEGLLLKSENKTQRYFRNKRRLRKIFPKKK